MEEDNDSEQATGSPTAADGGFVHVESADSAPIDDLHPASIHQVEDLEQEDDGVVVTGVDTVQDEPPIHEVRTLEDAGRDEFVDCPDDLVSSEVNSPAVVDSRSRRQPFGLDIQDIQIKASDSEKQIIPQDYEEERNILVNEVSNLHHQLKALSRQESLIDANDYAGDSSEITSGPTEGDEKSVLPLREMVNECSKLVELSLNEQIQSEGTNRELCATLNVKDKEIEDLTTRVNEQSIISQDVPSIEVVVDRVLSSLAIAFGDAGLSDTSVSGKLSHIEKSTSFLLESYHSFLSETQMLAYCLAEVRSDFQMETGMVTVFPSVREELVALKRKEFELNEKNTLLEYQHGQLMEQLGQYRETTELLNAEIGKLKGEVEQEKTRYSNSKDKLSMAVTKGKALVQQRDSLKQSVAEKTSELERCLIELQEKSTALEAAELRNSELTQTAILANSLQEALIQRDMILGKCAEILSLGLPEVAQFPSMESQVSWLLESYNFAKDQFLKLQDENNGMKEAATAQIDHLTSSLLVESQEKYHLKEELEEMTCRFEETVKEKNQLVSITESSSINTEVLEKVQSLVYVNDLDSKIYQQVLESKLDNQSHETVKVFEELRASKDEMSSLQINLQRSEEKASLLREKLSMAVKKGKGLVQERENTKQQMAEKNTQLEALMVDFQKQESTLSDYREQVTKLESERDQIGLFLAQSNRLLQETVEIIDGISISFPVDLKEPVEKVKWFATYLSECQVAKAQAEHELGDVKDEASVLTRKLTDALTNMKSLEDALSVSEKNVSQLSEIKRELEVSKTLAEQEVDILKEDIGRLNNKLMEGLKTLKTLEDKLADSEKTVGKLTEEKSELENTKCHVEKELHKAMEEATLQTSKFQEALSRAENNISMLVSEKEVAEMEVQKVKEEVSSHASNLDAAKSTIKSLEDAIYQLNTNVSQFSRENEKAEDSRTILASEIKKLKEEAEHEISILKSELSTCRQELAAKNDKVVVLENDIKVIVSTCDDVTKDLKFHLDNNMLQIESTIGPELTSSSHSVGDVKAAAYKLIFAASSVQSLIKQHVSIKEKMSTTIERLKAEFEKTSSMYDKSKEVNEELQGELEKNRIMYHRSKGVIEELHGELEKSRSVYEKVEEENDALQRKVFQYETELEASGNIYNELSSKLEDYRAKEEKWDERENKLSIQSISSVKDHEGDVENALLSASQMKTLFNKIDGVTIPFPNLVVGDTQPLDSNPVKKLFFIIDSVNELLDQLTHAKEDLQSTLTRQASEADLLKGEFKDGLQNIILKLGGAELAGVNKSADVAGLFLVLEKLVQGIVLDGENSRSKAQELSNRVKLLEEYIQNRISASDTIQKTPSLPSGSEISETDDQVSVGKAGLPLVPSVAQMRSLRKGSSNEQLAITIDSESERLLDKAATAGDKGHIFKSLNTSGLVPVQGKMIADRIDGIWVSGGQALMRRPRARLGLIAYWLLVHLWLLGTIL